VKSQAYDFAIADAAPGKNLQIFSQACPLFVPFAEEGWHQHEAAYIVAKEYLSSLQTQQIDTLILGCTHYPLLKAVIRHIMPDVALIDSGEEAALIAKQILLKNTLLNSSANIARKIEGFLTDVNPRFSQIATQFLGIPFNSLEQVNLDKTQIRTSMIFPSNLDSNLGDTISGDKKS
jgi:glutamate racemase